MALLERVSSNFLRRRLHSEPPRLLCRGRLHCRPGCGLEQLATIDIALRKTKETIVIHYLIPSMTKPDGGEPDHREPKSTTFVTIRHFKTCRRSAAASRVPAMIQFPHVAAGANGSNKGTDAASRSPRARIPHGRRALTCERVPDDRSPRRRGGRPRQAAQAGRRESSARSRRARADAISHSVAGPLGVPGAHPLRAGDARRNGGLSDPRAMRRPGALVGRHERRLLHDMPFALALAPRGRALASLSESRGARHLTGGPEGGRAGRRDRAMPHRTPDARDQERD